MKKQLLFLVLSAIAFSCKKKEILPEEVKKQPVVIDNSVKPASGNVITFEKISIPGTSATILPMPNQFFCTNIGPYVNVLNGAAKSNTIYKYRGGTGSQAWIAYPPESAIMSFTPSDLYDEGKDEVSYIWTSADPNFAYAYGKANLGNGSPSFKYKLRGADDKNQPYAFTSVYSSTSGIVKAWALSGNEIWHENANAENFELIARTQSSSEFLYTGFIDPDNGTFWCASEKKIYVPQVIGKKVSYWDVSSLGAGIVTGIAKAKTSIFIQYGRLILKVDGDKLEIVKQINQTGAADGGWSTMSTSGEILFLSDGTYYDELTKQWKSYVGSGLNLNEEESIRFKELTALLKAGYPIAATKGGGPVYLLTGREMVKLNPKL